MLAPLVTENDQGSRFHWWGQSLPFLTRSFLFLTFSGASTPTLRACLAILDIRTAYK